MKKNFRKVLGLVLIIAIICSVAVVFTACTKTKAEVTFGLITLHDSSSTYDKNFIDAVDVAVKNLKKEGIKVTKIVKSNVKESSECYDAAMDLVDQGCDIVMADSFGHEDYMIQAAKECPNVIFCHATGTHAHTANVANFYNAFASIYEGRYLAGVAAGMKLASMNTTNHKIGYVGAFTYAEVISGYTSFYLGVKSIVPDVTMDVKFTGSWYDPVAEKSTAQTLINGGCVLVSQHADSMGAPSACEEANVPNITYNVSTEDDCPNTYVIASRINWAPYYEYVIKSFVDKTEIVKDYVGTLQTGSVEILSIGTAAANGTQAKLDEVTAKIKSGELKIFDCSKFTVGGVNLTSYLADVDDLAPAFVHETEAIENGVFMESKHRSAPYFDLTIDGITLLNTELGD